MRSKSMGVGAQRDQIHFCLHLDAVCYVETWAGGGMLGLRLTRVKPHNYRHQKTFHFEGLKTAIFGNFGISNRKSHLEEDTASEGGAG